MESAADAPAAPLALSAVRRRYPRLHDAFSLLSYRERQYLGDMGDDICNVDAETGLLTKIACTDFAAPLEDPPADCAMKIDSDANRFSVFVASCLEAAESGDDEEDTDMQHTILQSALEDALERKTVASKFEHLLGWTAAGAHHGLHPLLSHGDADQNMALLDKASDEWRGLFEKVHRHGARLGVSVELRQFALRTCAMLKFFLRDAKDECGVRVGYTFQYLHKSAGHPPESVATVSGSVAADSNGSTAATSTAASTQSNSEEHRPRRVTVTVTKLSRDAKLGLGIGQRKGATGVKINSIPEGSLFSGTGLETGMVIESVNGEPYDSFAECLSLLKEAEGELTIVAVEQAVPPDPPVAAVALPAAPFRDEAPPSSEDESSVPSANSSVEPDEELDGEPDEESDADTAEEPDEESDEDTARLWERGGMVPGTTIPETIQYESEESENDDESDDESDNSSTASSAGKRKSVSGSTDSDVKRFRHNGDKNSRVAAAEFMERVNAVDGVQEGLVYDTCPEIVDKLSAFLQREGVTKASLQRALGGINGNSLGKFLTSEGQDQCGNITYRRGYVFFERLRLLEGEEKSLERLENEEEYPKGFPLSKRDWYSAD